jgi:DNA-binding transcriptional ArsR family regulator
MTLSAISSVRLSCEAPDATGSSETSPADLRPIPLRPRFSQSPCFFAKVHRYWKSKQLQAGGKCLEVDIYFEYSGYMDQIEAISALAALGQSTRLETFRLLVRNEPEGIPAGELARAMAVPQNTMSAHLAVLSRAGLVRGERHSRSIIYRADLDHFRSLVGFLLTDCCGGRPEICAPLMNEIACCDTMKTKGECA